MFDDDEILTTEKRRGNESERVFSPSSPYLRSQRARTESWFDSSDHNRSFFSVYRLLLTAFHHFTTARFWALVAASPTTAECRSACPSLVALLGLHRIESINQQRNHGANEDENH